MTADAKTILMLRHGKSDWQAAFASDHERPLAPRGRRASRLVGRWVRGAGLTPDLVLTSDAVRARTTAQLAAEAGDWGCPVRLEPGFYGASADTLIAALRNLDEGTRRVLLAGHFPAWPQAISRLTGGGHVRFPTAALAAISYVGPWRRLTAGGGELLFLVTPKLLAANGAE